MKTIRLWTLGLTTLSMFGMSQACVVVPDDDDSSGETGNNDTNNDSNNDSNNDTNNDTNNDDSNNDDDSSGEPPPECSNAGEGCAQNGDCCGFDDGESGCIDTGTGKGLVCADYCDVDADCESQCCAPLENGGGACAPAQFC